MSHPTAKQYAQAKDRGEAARRNGAPLESNPWHHASSECDRILRDAFSDAWCDEDARRRR